jgi:flavin-binding kelch repeat F-box protein 1
MLSFTIVPVSGPHSPPPTAAYAMCGLGNYIYLFGGRQFLPHSSPFCNEMWCLNVTDVRNVEWEKVPTQNTPPSRWGHTLLNYNGFLILFGGSEIGATYNDVWVLDVRHHHPELDPLDREPPPPPSLRWHRVIIAEGEPTPMSRGGHSAAIMVSTHLSYLSVCCECSS